MSSRIESEQVTSATIGGKNYRLSEFREIARATIVRQNDIAGATTTEREARPEILAWKLDDWGQGEGVAVFDPSREDHRSRYYQSTTPVDVSTPGQIKLGKDVTDSIASTTVNNSGPFLVQAGGNPWVGYDGTLKERTGSPDTWTSRTSGMTRIKGMTSLSGFVYMGGHVEVMRRRSTSAGPTQVTTNNGQTPIAAQGYLWWFNYTSSTGVLTLLRNIVDATAFTFTGTSMGTISYDFPSSSVVSSPVSYSSNLFFAVQPSSDEARLMVFDGSAVVERKTFPEGFRLYNTTDPVQSVAAMNDTIFTAGYYNYGTTNTASVEWVDARGFSGNLGRIREGTSLKAVSVTNTALNEMLIGLDSGQVFKYDMGTGGVSLFANLGSSNAAYDVVAQDGYYYFGWRNGSTGGVKRSSNYVTTSTVTHPSWHFGYPSQDKILYEMEVQTTVLPSGASVSLQVVVDDTTTVTTDINGTTMTHSSGSRSVFTLNQTGRRFQPKIVLTTSNTSNTPTVLSVTLRAQANNKINYYYLGVDLDDTTARTPGRWVSGAKAANELRALKDAGGTFSIILPVRGTHDPLPEQATSSNTKTVMFAADEDSYDLQLVPEKKCRLILREASG